MPREKVKKVKEGKEISNIIESVEKEIKERKDVIEKLVKDVISSIYVLKHPEVDDESLSKCINSAEELSRLFDRYLKGRSKKDPLIEWINKAKVKREVV